MNIQGLNNVAGLKPETMRFISGLAASGTPRSMETSISIARVIACKLALTTTEDAVDEGGRELAYAIMHSTEVTAIVDTINELIIIDRQAVMKFTRDFWCYRVDVANLDPVSYSLREDQKVADFFGIRKHFSDEVLSVIANTTASFVVLTNNFSILVDTILGKTE